MSLWGIIGQKKWQRNTQVTDRGKTKADQKERDLQIALIKAANLIEKHKKPIWFRD